jgi:nucleoside-diphosphate-sugar epimerase
MRKKVILITGAAGEIGQALINNYVESGQSELLTLDLHSLPDELKGKSTHIVGDVLDQKLFARLVTEYDFDTIFHMAALLSTRSEFAPDLAHQVNVNGTLT